MSESNKFTPGPWTNMPRMECVPICGQHDVGLSIGFINSSNPDRMAEGRANAYLIAAAPDLLEALKNLENDDGQIPDHAWTLCQDAIRAAEGEMK